MSDTTSLGWAAYAAGITVLGGLASLSGNPKERFAIAPQNSFSLPIVQNTGAQYQNFALRDIAGKVPTSNAVFTSTGQYYDEALYTYLTWASPILPNDPTLLAQLTQAQTEQNQTLTKVHSELATAKLQYLSDCPGGIYILTGAPITFANYINIWFPSINDDLAFSAELNTIIQAYQLEISGQGETVELNNWLSAVAKGVNNSYPFPGFNSPVQLTDATDTSAVATGAEPALSTPAAYVPAWSIGGGYNTVAKEWIDTFPADYPASTAAYYTGASSYFSQNTTSYENFWQSYGYSSQTSVTGSDFFFFSWEDSTTQQTVTQSVDVNEGTFGPSIEIHAWGIGSFPVSMGLWYSGNPLTTFPQVSASAPPQTIPNVKSQVTQVIMGYGIEVKFTLYNQTYNDWYGYYTTTVENSGYMSVFGFLFGSGGGGYSSTTNSWSQVTWDDNTQTVTLLAQADGVPQLLGVVITDITA